jgi:hypothetical protein
VQTVGYPRCAMRELAYVVVMVDGRSFPEPLIDRPSAIARLRAVLLVAVSGVLVSGVPAVAATLSLPTGHRSTEANVALDPTDPNDVLVLARDEDRGRLVGLRMWRSHDGGRSFRGGMLVNRRMDGMRANASDPVALFDNVGRPAPAFLALRYGRSTWESRIMLGRRVVVRAQYGRPFPTLSEGFGTRRWYDKPWAAFDPTDGSAYVTWTERSANKTGPVEKVAVTSAPAGKSFPRARVLGNGSGSQPVVGPGSTVVVVWYFTPNLSMRAEILSSRSLDRGRSWSAPTVVASGVNVRGDAPFPTVVRTSSAYVACWQQYGTWPRERIACSRSSDGATWSRARIVAQPPGAGDAAQPALAAAPDGRLWLAFYRFDRRSTSVELWTSRPGMQNWQRRGVLMRRPVPRSGSYFLGDYEGLAATGDRVIAAFVMPVRAHAFRQVVEVSRFSTRH